MQLYDWFSGIAGPRKEKFQRARREGLVKPLILIGQNPDVQKFQHNYHPGVTPVPVHSDWFYGGLLTPEVATSASS